MDETTALLDKSIDALTVRDTLKINLVVAAAMLAIPVVVIGGATAIDKLVTWKKNRKNKPPFRLTED